MGFRYEYDLMMTVCHKIPELFGKTPPAWALEIPVGAGTVDLLMAWRTPEFDRVPQPLSAIERATYFWVCYQYGVKLSGLQAFVDGYNSYVPKYIKRGVIQKLVDWGYIRIVGERCYKVPMFGPRFISIEGKLSKWRTCFHQAYRNTLFSDAYVAIDADHARPAIKALDELFIHHNVGLMVVHTSGLIDMIHKPLPKPYYSGMVNNAQLELINRVGRLSDY